jgi:hypothetical protein
MLRVLPFWRSLPKSQMRAVLVVVANILREPTFRVAFVSRLGTRQHSGIRNSHWEVLPTARIPISSEA